MKPMSASFAQVFCVLLGIACTITGMSIGDDIRIRGFRSSDGPQFIKAVSLISFGAFLFIGVAIREVKRQGRSKR